VERSEYERLAAAEDGMWWFRGLHAHMLAALARGGTVPGRILDAGCGTGGLLARLAAGFPRSWTVGLDIDEGAASVARGKSGKPVCRGSVERLPFAEDAFDAILSADVLCHRGVDAGRALQGFRRCLKPGGLLVLNLPAYGWLYSAHDVAVDNARRFGRGELAALLAAAGFEHVRTRFWNSLLFPLMVVRRKLWRRGTAGTSDVELQSPPVERVLGAVMAFESRLAAAGIFLPFGGSILASAVKP
jgi:SAM-dependent methyltransferase